MAITPPTSSPPPSPPASPPPAYDLVFGRVVGHPPPAVAGPAPAAESREAQIARRLAEIDRREAEVARLRDEVANLQIEPLPENAAPAGPPGRTTADEDTLRERVTRETSEPVQQGPPIVRVTSLPKEVRQDQYQLLRDASKGNVKGLKSGLEKGLNPNATYAQGATALILAAQGGHRECVELLLDHRDVNRHCLLKGLNALCWAAGEDLETCRLLVNRGFVDNDAAAALLQAADSDRVDVVDFLLTNGGVRYSRRALTRATLISINKQCLANLKAFYGHLQTTDGLQRAFILAARKENPECLRFLLSKLPEGCDLVTYMSSGMNPGFIGRTGFPTDLSQFLESMHCDEHLNRLNILIERFPNVPFLTHPEYASSLLISGIRLSNRGCIQKLIDRGIDLSSLSSAQSGKILKSCVNSSLLDIIPTLQRMGVDINGVAARTTALHYAARYDSSAVATLLRLGADPNSRDSEGNTPLHCAVGRDFEAFQVIANAPGVLLDAANIAGQTALHIAARKDRAAAEVLLTLGVDPTVCDNEGNTPLHYGSRNNPGMFTILSNVPHVDVKARNDEGRTALHISATYASVRLTKEMLKHRDVDIFVRDNNGKTALDIARESGQTEKADYLEAEMKKRAK